MYMVPFETTWREHRNIEAPKHKHLASRILIIMDEVASMSVTIELKKMLLVNVMQMVMPTYFQVSELYFQFSAKSSLRQMLNIKADAEYIMTRS